MAPQGSKSRHLFSDMNRDVTNTKCRTDQLKSMVNLSIFVRPGYYNEKALKR